MKAAKRASGVIKILRLGLRRIPEEVFTLAIQATVSGAEHNLGMGNIRCFLGVN